MIKRAITFLAIPIALVALIPVDRARAADLIATWDNSNDFWSAAAHWSTMVFPNNGNGGLTYDALIGGGTVTLDQDIAIQRYTQSGGSLVALSATTLTLNELFT